MLYDSGANDTRKQQLVNWYIDNDQVQFDTEANAARLHLISQALLRHMLSSAICNDSTKAGADARMHELGNV